MQKVYNIEKLAWSSSIGFDKKILRIIGQSVENSCAYQNAFLVAPNKAAIKECIELYKGCCAIKYANPKRFTYGKIYHVKYGDPIYMVIIPVDRQVISGYPFKIFRLLKHNGELSDVYLYVDISNYCTCVHLEIIEEIK
ncbi:MAG: hypothetical protein ABH884_00015 [Candidatus Komeilibacteria bacterium]